MLFTSDFGDGDDHYHWDLPMLVAGHAGGRWKPGRHIAYPHKGGGGPSNKTDTPMANLFVSVLQAFDIPATTFGSMARRPTARARWQSWWASGQPDRSQRDHREAQRNGGASAGDALSHDPGPSGLNEIPD